MNFVVFGVPIHICQHELMAAAAAIPMLGFCVICARKFLGRFFKVKK